MMAGRVSKKHVKSQALKPKSRPIDSISSPSSQEAARSKIKPRAPIIKSVKVTNEPQITVSTSSILRRKPLKQIYSNRRSRRYGRGVSDLEDDLLLNIQDQVAESRADLQSKSISALNQTRTELITSLEKIHISGVAFQDNIFAQQRQLVAPLANETIETVYRQGSRSRTVAMNIGQRVENFGAMVEATEVKIKSCWADWEVVQRKIIELGTEVLGPEAFDSEVGSVQEDVKGYRKEVEILDAEEKAFREEIENELQFLGREAMDKMRATEKELNASLKKQKAELFAKLLQEDD